jgi:effector-binding domain-containing protein
VEPAGRVAVSELPGGLVASALHRGGYGGLGETYEVIGRWSPEHGYAVDGAPWESYLDCPETPEPRALVSFPARQV